SKTTAPTQSMLNRALGCGCPDGSGCNAAYAGLRKQLDCGATTLRRWYDASVEGTGEWRKGKTRRTLDKRSVTPQSNATASVYAATTRVPPNTCGAWPAWNVTRKHVRHATATNLIH